MRGLAGLRFRRQAPLGAYIVDFVCLDRILVVELDGDQHGHEGQRKADLNRTRWLEGQGFRVIRFSNHDVRLNVEGVCTAIAEAAGVTL